MDENKVTGPLPDPQDFQTGPLPDVEEYLAEPEQADEIQAAEAAMEAAGLTHPDDSQTDRILEEAWDLSEPAYEEEAPVQPEEPEQIYSDGPYSEPYAEEPYEDAFGEEPPLLPTRKGRPKRKSGYGLLGIPHILVTVIWLAIVVMIGVSLGRVLWVSVADVMAFGREEQEITVTIEESDTIEDIALKLQDAGLIRYTQLFELYAIVSDAREDISAGTYTLNTIYDYHALVNSMNYYSAAKEEVTVMIPEGYTCAQIFELLAEKKVCSAAELEAYAAQGELDEYWFLEDVERGSGNCLEGFLFPDTYNFYIDDSAEVVLEKMLDNFDYRFSEEHIAALEALNARLAEMMAADGHDEAYIEENKLSVRDLVTVASLIEKETSGAEESPTIASVIYNRLFNWGSTPRFLNIDAALLYVLGHKEALTTEDLQTDSPYNTYMYTGLVPGPIANPGLSSIEAALYPADTGYYYYVYDPNAGEHLFAASADEHDRNVASISQGG